MDQRAAQAQLLLHAAGELARRPLAKGGQARALQQIGDTPLALLAFVSEQAAEEIDVLEDGERRVEVLAQPLRHVGDALADGAAVAGLAHVAAEHMQRSALHLARAGQQRQQAGLADAVRADQPHHAPGRQFQAHIVQGMHAPVLETDAVQPCDWTLVHSGTFTSRCSGQGAFGSSRR
ncbi:hypothetical protein D9M71_225590 [compost metagenome]